MIAYITVSVRMCVLSCAQLDMFVFIQVACFLIIVFLLYCGSLLQIKKMLYSNVFLSELARSFCRYYVFSVHFCIGYVFYMLRWLTCASESELDNVNCQWQDYINSNVLRYLHRNSDLITSTFFCDWVVSSNVIESCTIISNKKSNAFIAWNCLSLITTHQVTERRSVKYT